MKKIPIILTIFSILSILAFISSCASAESLATVKSGAQLWGENCIRCHNAPSPAAFSDHEWDVATMHMRVRANLTNTEANKIVGFLKMAN